jgi:hypothetical protein
MEMFMSDQLKAKFAEAVAAMSYYNAAEFPMWGRETEKRQDAQVKLKSLYEQMVHELGRIETNEYLSTLPRLLGSGDLE